MIKLNIFYFFGYKYDIGGYIVSLNLETEALNISANGIDTMSTAEILRIINDNDKGVALAVSKVIPAINDLVDACFVSIKNGARIFYVGAGTSGRLGVLDASEILPTFGEGNFFVGLIAGGLDALVIPIEGAEDDTNSLIGDLKSKNFSKDDFLIGITASGRTPCVVGALDYAKSIGAMTGAISCVSHSKVSEHADFAVDCPVGAEVISGSTRMKSGTATKMILNMISTTIMVKYGKVFNGFMVDVKPSNEKLVMRATGIIKNICDIDDDSAKDLLERSGFNVKVAIIMGLTKIYDTSLIGDILMAEGNNVAAAIRKLKTK